MGKLALWVSYWTFSSQDAGLAPFTVRVHTHDKFPSASGYALFHSVLWLANMVYATSVPPSIIESSELLCLEPISCGRRC